MSFIQSFSRRFMLKAAKTSSAVHSSVTQPHSKLHTETPHTKRFDSHYDMMSRSQLDIVNTAPTTTQENKEVTTLLKGINSLFNKSATLSLSSKDRLIVNDLHGSISLLTKSPLDEEALIDLLNTTKSTLTSILDAQTTKPSFLSLFSYRSTTNDDSPSFVYMPITATTSSKTISHPDSKHVIDNNPINTRIKKPTDPIISDDNLSTKYMNISSLCGEIITHESMTSIESNTIAHKFHEFKTVYKAAISNDVKLKLLLAFQDVLLEFKLKLDR